MKKFIVPLALLLLAGPARAQERIPDEEARNIARQLIEAAKKVKAPVAIDVDADKPYGKHKDEYGAMVLPDKNLSAERLAKAGKDEIVPIGQFWMRSLAPAVDGKVVPSKNLQMLTVTHNDKEYSLVLCYLGVRKGPKDALELVVLSKDKTPLLKAPLEKTDEKQELPVEFTASIEGNDRAHLKMSLLGRYRAKVTLGVLTD
ncbi:MAG: hypothetical protein HYS12_15720 [Planctomycetes bacterium]|nr:hypothetical protein [Planctomycetota bacterium]